MTEAGMVDISVPGIVTETVHERTIYGEGSRIFYDCIPSDYMDLDFENIKKEIEWGHMYSHGSEVPRLVANQVSYGKDGAIPLYRHPTDKLPPVSGWTPNVLRIRNFLEKKLGLELNHCLIQLYRTPSDSINDHSDKTLDIAPGSKIVNFSIGASRTMNLKSKNKVIRDGVMEREIQKIPLHHNSVLVMDLETNAKWLHGIKANKRPVAEMKPCERLYEGQRISFTFRTIATFLSTDGKLYGRGAPRKILVEDSEAASDEVISSVDDTTEMFKVFNKENAEMDFDWDANYGTGFYSKQQ